MFVLKYGFVSDPYEDPEYDSYPVAIVAEDYTFTSGDVGYSTDNIKVCFDGLDV